MYNGIKFEFTRELRNIFSDKSLILMLLAAPLFYAFFYGSAYLNKVERELELVIVDYDQSATSRMYSRMLDASGIIKVTGNEPQIDVAMNSFYQAENKAVIYIPKGFEKELKKGKGSDVKIYLNNTRFLPSNDIVKAVSEISATVGAGIRLKYLRAQGLSSGQAIEVVEPLRIDMRSLHNTTESYGDFLIPGIFILILQQTLLIGLGESIAKDREKGLIGTKQQWWKSGKALPYLIMFTSYAFLFFTVAFDVFGIPQIGNYLLLMVTTVIFLIAVVLFTYFISSFFKTKFEALILLAFTSYPVFLISGYSWPSMSMPLWVKYLGYIIPSTPFLEAYIKITQFGAGFDLILPQMIHLIALAFVFALLNKLRYYKFDKTGLKV